MIVSNMVFDNYDHFQVDTWRKKIRNIRDSNLDIECYPRLVNNQIFETTLNVGASKEVRVSCVTVIFYF